jgi:hypothetical protein
VLGRLPTVQRAAEGQPIDQALAQAYRLLDSMLSTTDLRRDLGQIIEQQEEIAAATKQQVKEVILNRQDPEGLKDTGRRQRELARRMQEWERRLLQDPEHKDDAVATGIAQASAARSLHRAADPIEQGNASQRAIAEQQEALERMRSWYAGLEQGDGSGQQQQSDALQAALEALISRHRDFAGLLEEGKALAALAPDWRTIDADSAALATQITALGNEQATVSVGLVRQVQAHVVRSLEGGRREAALLGVQEALGYLEQLRDLLQRRAAGEEDLMDLIRRLHARQQELVVNASDLLQQAAAGELGFRDRERLGGLAPQEQEIAEILQKQVQPVIAENAIALWAVEQAQVALEAAVHEFAQRPDQVRQRGVDLARAAAIALSRLIEVGGEEAPSEGGNTGGGGGQGQQQQGPPYPPRAALNLLRQAQERLARQTMSVGSPHALEDQDELLQLIEPLLGQTRPGTRPAQLLERTRLSMEAAIAGIVRGDGEDRVANWQRAAVGDLERLLAEMRMQMQSSGGGSNSQQQQPQQSEQQPKPGQQDSQQAGVGGEGEAQAADGSGLEGVPQEQRGWLLQFPPAERQRLLEAVGAGLPPEGLELYRRYMDLLEERLR